MQTVEERSGGMEPRRQQERLWAWLAPVIGGLIFLPTLWYGFVWDDRFGIVTNTSLQSWKTLAKTLWGPMDPTRDMYRPVTGLIVFFEYHLFGLHAWGYHLVSVGLHAMACAVLYWVALRLSGKQSIAVFAGVLFAVHAAHLEAVAWVSALAEPLVVSAILAGFLCYLRYREQRQTKWLAGVCLSLWVGLLSKETAIVLPLLLMAYEWTFGERTFGNVRRSFPLIASLGATGVVYVVMRHLAYKRFVQNESKLPFSELVFTWPSLLLAYCHHLFLPTSLSPFYDSRYVTTASRSFWLPLLALITIAAAAYVGSRFFENGRLIHFCVWAMAISIIPVLDLNIFQFQEIFHDRFLYLPSAFFAIFVGQFLFGEHRGEHLPAGAAVEASVGTSIQNSGANVYLILGAVMILLNAAALLIQSSVWKNDMALMSYAVRIAPGNPRPAFTLATLELEHGDLPQAEQMLQHVVELVPAPKAYFLLGETRMRMGETKLAEQPLRQAIAAAPERAGQHFALAECLEEMGRTDEARTEFKAEIAVSETYKEAVVQKLSQLGAQP